MAINYNEFQGATSHAHVTPGEALKILRELQGFSQTELEELTHISQSNISALENSKKQMGRERALILAKALKVHPAVLLFPDYEMDLAA